MHFAKTTTGRKKRNLKNWRMHSMLERIDVFGQPLPMFNLKGTSEVHTMTGGVLSFAIFVVFIIYGSIKMIHLLSKHNPQVSQVLEMDVFTFEDELELNDIDFRVAFSVEGYHSREMKDDPRYVKWLVRFFTIEEGQEVETMIPFHKCTDEDWEKFRIEHLYMGAEELDLHRDLFEVMPYFETTEQEELYKLQ